ncbi:stage III sporulation protein SpoIIIAB [Garciella nitratireducens]|uniref:Stage III sporulation protein AB n=1 Tax=Garciella nitratireducens DSM 15102 TaxID=1121911 RepID=A0A1T4K4N5_9FIRM|nr:stage III sporulation protein SpoIIIAB [Garciella nitratireducens]RBP46666.1 stage III sporulation protein AB [Garciella nitratireducens]SJZ37287.1 stage III sporulation protein AB [Garciella nitratireducens DSM 15102]
MIKIFGSTIVLISSTLIGLLMANKYKARVRQLKEIRNSFQMIEIEIFYTATPIIEVMEKLSKQSPQPLKEIFNNILNNLKKRKGESLGDIWKKSFEKERKYTAFTQEDLEVIYFFGSILGTSDRESQLKNAKLVQSQLLKLQEYAEREWIKNERLYKNLGILSGLTVIIILV